jgi:probable F420-dependent oxidoreductase
MSYSSLGLGIVYRKEAYIANTGCLVSVRAAVYMKERLPRLSKEELMRFGMFLPSFGPLAAGSGAVDTLRTLAQKAEAMGFDSLWVPDHVVIPTTIKSRYPYNDSGRFPIPPEVSFLEPLSMLGYLAGITQRVRLGTWVLVLPHRNPIVTAKMFASLDVLSRGRMMLGAGIGWMEEEISLLGAPFQKRGALSDEYLRAMKELWTNPDPQFEGQFVRFSGIKCEPKPVQQPFPVWIGGHSARAMRRVVEFGDGWVAVPKSFAAFQESYDAIKAAAAKAGRDVKSIKVMIGPASATSVDTFVEEMKKYQGLGYDSFFAPLPFWSGERDGVLRLMDEFARKVGM